MRPAPPLSAMLALACASLGAFEPQLSPGAIQDALNIGTTSLESARRDFHRPYRTAVSRPPVDYIDVVTPFRRVVLAAENQRALGNRSFGQREAIASVGDVPGDVDLEVELTFHPMNTYVAVPDYRVRLLARSATVALVEPRTIDRIPRYGPRLSGVPPTGQVLTPEATPGVTQPLTGGRLIVTLTGALIDAKGIYDVLIDDGHEVIGEATIDFGRLR